jgi:dCTP diphosphatase
MTELDDIVLDLRRFANERDWEQFHSPRNLMLALAGEVGELVSLVQWVPDTDMQKWWQDSRNRKALEEEIADVLLYTLRIADVLGIDPMSVMREKLQLNAERYPVKLSRGSAVKYTDLPKEQE